MSLLSLPRELQLLIIGLLPVRDLLRLSETCHTLKDLARDPSLWKKLVLSYKNIKNNPKACREHVARCSKLRELTIIHPDSNRTDSKSKFRSDQIMSVVMKAKNTLTTLSIGSFTFFGVSSFKKISQITNLTKLGINASNFIEAKEFFQLNNISKLRSLKIHHLHYVLGEALGKTLVKLALDCPGLEHLDVSGCLKNELIIPVQYLEEFLRIASQARLRHLDIRDCDFNHKFVKNLKQKYPHIKIVDKH